MCGCSFRWSSDQRNQNQNQIQIRGAEARSCPQAESRNNEYLSASLIWISGTGGDLYANLLA